MAKRTRMTELEAYAVKTRQSEPVGSRGKGTLLLERKASGAILAFYRERTANSDKRLPLGILAKKPKLGTDECTLNDIRAEALRISAEVGAVGGLEQYLELKAQQAAAAEAERLAAEQAVQLEQLRLQRLAEIEAAQGTFGELFLDYIESRRDKATPSVIKELDRLYRTNMLQPHPSLMAMKAREIRPDHILSILDPIWERGSKVQADRMRSFLVAAFNHGLRAENAVGRANAKRYSLESNPAAVVAVEKVSAPVERALSDAELRQLWYTIESTEGVGPVMALLFKFVIATGGQRIFNICQTTWEDYDLQAETVRLVHRKGRKDAGAGATERPHLVPLSARAIGILEQVKEINGHYLWPWTTTGKQHIVVSSPRHAIADWLASPHAVVDGKPVPSFSPRDLRRTCAQLMQRHGVSDSLSDLLQAHGQTGVVGKHYRNNPEAALPEKRRAIELFDLALEQVLQENIASDQAGKVVLLSKRKNI